MTRNNEPISLDTITGIDLGKYRLTNASFVSNLKSKQGRNGCGAVVLGSFFYILYSNESMSGLWVLCKLSSVVTKLGTFGLFFYYEKILGLIFLNCAYFFAHFVLRIRVRVRVRVRVKVRVEI